MSTTKKILGALLVVALVGAGGVLLWRGRGAPAGDGAPTASAGGEDDSARRPPRFQRALTLPTGEISRDDSAAGSVEGQVVSASGGAGIAGAELSFSFAGSSVPAVTDAQGRFRFAPTEPGGYLLARVAAEGYIAFSPEWGDSPIAFSLRAGERVRGVKLALRSARACRGEVVDEQGRPAPGARLSTWLPRGTSPPGSVPDAADEGGRFQFPALEGLTIEAHHTSNGVEKMARDQVGFSAVQQCHLRLRLRQLPAVAGKTITGRVLKGDGTPAPGIQVDAWTNPILAPDAHYMIARAESDAQGRFQLGPVDASAYLVTATVSGRAAADREEVPAGARDLVLRLPASGTVRGVVVDAQDGRPVPSFSLALFRNRARGDALWGVFTRYDGQGAFELSGVPVGSYQVTAVAEGRSSAEETKVEVLADPAPTPTLRFSLRTGNRVFGLVTDRATRLPVAGARVALEGRAGVAAELPLRAEITSGSDGSFELRGLPSGRLSLLVTADGHHGRVLGGLDIKADRDLGPVAVDLAPTREGEKPRIELVGIGAAVARKGDTVVLGALSPEGGASRAGLQTGDTILAIDGRTVGQLGGLEGAVGRIRGAEGTVVVFRVRRAVDGLEQDVRVTRSLVKGP